MQSLPIWLQIIGLICGLLWPLYQLLHVLIGPKLEVQLTRDIFFRFIDQGECLFLRPVLISEYGNVLIKEVTATLIRKDPKASKTLALEFLKFGEVMLSSDSVESNFCFHSSSPARFLSKGHPVQAVYLARSKSYGGEYAALYTEFHDELKKMKAIATPYIGKNDDKEGQANVAREFEDLCKKYSGKILAKVQFEPGEYEVSISIRYSGIGSLTSFFDRNTKLSKLKFAIEANAHEQIRAALPQALYTFGLNTVFNTTAPINYPQYNPVQTIEDPKS